jgi:hypothetical protein
MTTHKYNTASERIMKVGFVYKLVCKDVNATEVYVGSSVSLRNRRATHKSDCNNKNGKAYDLPVYQYIRKHEGWDNWELLPIERFEFDFKFELHDRERFHMEALHATLNALVPHRTKDEYRRDNAEIIKQSDKQYGKQYRIDHKEGLEKKYDCPCGGRYTHEHKARHLKTEWHYNYILGKQIYEAKFGHA